MWMSGSFVIKGIQYYYEAKVFDEGSRFGILDGRISKLKVWKCVSKELRTIDNAIISYDRGWDVRPSFDDREVLDYILDLYPIS